MCSREIAHYKRLDRKQSVLWVDITRQSKTLALYGVSHTAAMQRFHVLNIEGKWQIGAWGFVEMWSQLPGYRWLAKAIRWINAESLLDRVYVGFAKWRAKHRCVEECRPLQ
jgi:predicted DCC family thiol-disulfide oxidoreductase YuxK